MKKEKKIPKRILKEPLYKKYINTNWKALQEVSESQKINLNI